MSSDLTGYFYSCVRELYVWRVSPNNSSLVTLHNLLFEPCLCNLTYLLCSGQTESKQRPWHVLVCPIAAIWLYSDQVLERNVRPSPYTFMDILCTSFSYNTLLIIQQRRTIG